MVGRASLLARYRAFRRPPARASMAKLEVRPEPSCCAAASRGFAPHC
jgi:hypothetical protein